MHILFLYRIAPACYNIKMLKIFFSGTLLESTKQCFTPDADVRSPTRPIDPMRAIRPSLWHVVAREKAQRGKPKC